MPVETCQACMGTGMIDNVICNTCWGTGVLPLRGVAYQNSILAGMIQGVTAKLPSASKLIYTYQIVEVINAAEYAALVDPAKDGLRVILSCGIVDLVHTGKIYTNLIAIFGSSPITTAAIEAL